MRLNLQKLLLLAGGLLALSAMALFSVASGIFFAKNDTEGASIALAAALVSCVLFAALFVRAEK